MTPLGMIVEDTGPAHKKRNIDIQAIARNSAIVLLGFVVPTLVLYQAYINLGKLEDVVGTQRKDAEITKLFIDAKKELKNANDYALFSLIQAESANQRTMLNKQIMKTGIMQIGFAVISVGMMFIVLGFNDGGLEAGGGSNGLKFNLKTGSTGIAIFLVGAVMATAGGVLKNDYATVPLPGYVWAITPEGKVATTTTVNESIITLYELCKEFPPHTYQACIISKVEEQYREAKK